MRRALAIALALVFVAPASGHPGHAPPTVSIAVYAFAPSTITLVEGDVVQWNWNGPDVNHSVTSDKGSALKFDSGVKTQVGDTFSEYFAKAGTYTYHCSVHGNMRGTVVVQPGVQYDTTAPVLSKVKLAAATRKRATVSFVDSEDGTATMEVRRRGSTKLLRHSFTFVKAGAAKTRVRMAGLAAGHYVISLSAQDATGNVSAVKKVKVTR